MLSHKARLEPLGMYETVLFAYFYIYPFIDEVYPLDGNLFIMYHFIHFLQMLPIETNRDRTFSSNLLRRRASIDINV